MKCLITQWIIDRYEESGRPLPGSAEKHIETCDACRAYMNTGRLLSISGTGAGPDVPGLDALNEKIFDRIRESGSERQRRKTPGFRFGFAAAATLMVVVISTGIFLVRDRKGTPAKPAPVIHITFEKIADMKDLNGLLARVESPMIREAEVLKDSFNSARNYLRSVMDFSIPGIRD